MSIFYKFELPHFLSQRLGLKLSIHISSPYSVSPYLLFLISSSAVFIWEWIISPSSAVFIPSPAYSRFITSNAPNATAIPTAPLKSSFSLSKNVAISDEKISDRP